MVVSILVDMDAPEVWGEDQWRYGEEGKLIKMYGEDMNLGEVKERIVFLMLSSLCLKCLKISTVSWLSENYINTMLSLHINPSNIKYI